MARFEIDPVFRLLAVKVDGKHYVFLFASKGIIQRVLVLHIVGRPSVILIFMTADVEFEGELRSGHRR